MIKHKYIVATNNLYCPYLWFFDDLKEAKSKMYETMNLYSNDKDDSGIDIILAEVLDWKEIKVKRQTINKR